MFNKCWLLVVILLVLLNVLLLFFTATILEKRRLAKKLENYHVTNPQNYRFILDQPEKCVQQKPFVVVIVPVAPGNVETRHAIRITWGSEKFVRDKVVLILFLLGFQSGNERLQEQLRIESQKHKDLLQSNFLDTYRNLTIKTMVMMEWLSRKCPQASYGVKVDADVLLNVKNLLHMLVNLKSLQKNYITGLVLSGNSVLRDPSSKFFVPYEVYPRSRYPPYPLGMCYIFSMDLPKKILQVSRFVRPVFIEDAYVGMCLNRLGITPKKPPNVGQFVVRPPQQFDRCYYSGLIAVHTDNLTQLISYWMNINLSNKPC